MARIETVRYGGIPAVRDNARIQVKRARDYIREARQAHREGDQTYAKLCEWYADYYLRCARFMAKGGSFNQA